MTSEFGGDIFDDDPPSAAPPKKGGASKERPSVQKVNVKARGRGPAADDLAFPPAAGAEPAPTPASAARQGDRRDEVHDSVRRPAHDDERRREHRPDGRRPQGARAGGPRADEPRPEPRHPRAHDREREGPRQGPMREHGGERGEEGGRPRHRHEGHMIEGPRSEGQRSEGQRSEGQRTEGPREHPRHHRDDPHGERGGRHGRGRGRDDRHARGPSRPRSDEFTAGAPSRTPPARDAFHDPLEAEAPAPLEELDDEPLFEASAADERDESGADEPEDADEPVADEADDRDVDDEEGGGATETSAESALDQGRGDERGFGDGSGRRRRRRRGRDRDRGDRGDRGFARDNRGSQGERMPPASPAAHGAPMVPPSMPPRTPAPAERGARGAEAEPKPAWTPAGPASSARPTTTTQRIALFLDVEAIQREARAIGGQVSFSRALRQIAGARTVVRALAYCTPQSRGTGGAGGLETVRVERESDTAVAIAVDALATAARVDCVVFAPESAAPAPLIRALRAHGVRVESAGFEARGHTEVADHQRLGKEALFVP
jgi:hypothetical protein